MQHELKEVRDILDKRETWRPGPGVSQPPDEDELIRCVQTLMSRQCLYQREVRYARSFRIIASPAYQDFFRKYFAVMGLELVHDQRAGMIALKVPAGAKRIDWQASRLKKDETLVLLALRLAYEEGFHDKRMGDDGEVDISTDDLLEKLEVVAGATMEETRLTEILSLLKKHGVLSLGERDPVDRVRPLTILPGIEIVVPQTYAEHIKDWAGEAADGAAASGEGAADAAERQGDGGA